MNHSLRLLCLFIGLLLLPQLVYAKGSTQDLLKQLSTQVKALTSQLQQSNARISALEKQLQQSQLNSPPQPIATTNNHDLQNLIPSPHNTAETTKADKPAVTVGDVKGTFKIPNTETSLGLGGYIKTDAIFNSVSAGRDKLGDQMAVYSQIPLGNSPGEHSQTTFHAKESRLWLRSFTPSSWGDINTYLEMDFYGDAATYSYTPRLRHAYGSIGNFLVGQTWTTFINSHTIPDLLNFGGSAGTLNGIRQPQLRWTQPFNLADTPMEFQLALETPRSVIRDTPAADASVFSSPNSERYPDMIARLNFNPDWGNLSLATMARQIRNTDASSGRSQQAWGGAVNLAGKIDLFEQDNLRFMFSYGNALGRYATFNTFEDAAINPQGSLALVNTMMAMFSYQHFWSKNWRSTLAYGFANAEQPNFVGGNMTRQAQSAHANLLWSPVSQTTFGAEYIYLYRDSVDGRNGDLHRVQFSARYSF